MDDFTILKELIKKSATLNLDRSHQNGKRKVTLSEPQHANASVIIDGLPTDTIVIKADAFTSPTSIFKGEKSECKRADFIIISAIDDQKTIICLEMKAGHGGEEHEIVNQLRGAQCLIAYIREIGRIFWNAPDFLDRYALRFVSVKKISVVKRTIRPQKMQSPSVHDRPDRMLKISGEQNIQFNRLIGDKSRQL